MNIKTTQLPVTAGVSNIIKSSAPMATEEKAEATTVAAPQEKFTPEVDGESRGSAAWRAGIRKGVSWGDTLEKPLGGAAAIGLAIGGGLALSLGGAMVGGMVGGSFGTAVSALQSSGPLNFVANSFSNMGTAMSIGTSVGSVAGVAGGLYLGSKVGGTVGKTAAFLPGFVVGAAQGAANPGSVPAPQPKERKEVEHKKELTGLFKGTAKVGGGIGLLSGAAGGFVTGATIAAAGSLVTDVAQGDFSFSNFMGQLGSTAIIGGAIGGVGGAALGAAGGTIVFGTGPQWVWDNTGGKLTANQPGIQDRLEKREDELANRKQTLEAQADNLTQETSGYRERHAQTSTMLDGRENQMAGDEARVSSDLNEVSTRIETNAQADFKTRSASADPSLDTQGNHGVIGERVSLDSWEAKLNGWQGDLNNFRSELTGWEAKLDNTIDLEAGKIFAEERKPIDSHFGKLHGELDKFEGKLNAYEVDVNNRIQNKYQAGLSAEKPGVVSDLNQARNEKSQSETQLSNARSEKERAESQYNSAQRSKDSAKSRLRSAESEESNLRSRISSLNSRISSLQSQVSSCRSSL